MTTIIADMRDAFIDGLYHRALTNPDILFLSSEYGAPSLDRFREEMPAQFVNTAISEQNLISVAAGLSMMNKRVFVYSIASFITLRCFEQLKIDLCCMKRPVTIIGVGTAYAYSADGPTHHATEDISLMRSLANMTIYSPCDFRSAGQLVDVALGHDSGPMYIRLDKGKYAPVFEEGVDLSPGFSMLHPGRAGVCLLATGTTVHRALEVKELLAAQGCDAAVVDVYRIKPLPAALTDVISRHRMAVSIEEHTLNGGLGGLLAEAMADARVLRPLLRCGIRDDKLYAYGMRDRMHAERGLDAASVAAHIMRELTP